MAHSIEQARNFIQAINTANLFTELVDGTLDLEKEQKSDMAARIKVWRLFVATIALGIASLVTVPWEVISRLRQGHFALRGYGFLPPAAGLGAIALGLYYALPSFHRCETLKQLNFKQDIKTNNILGNLQLIKQATDHHFKELKNIAQPDPDSAPNSEALPVLIHLHYLTLYCRILYTTPSDKRVEKKNDQGHYFGYKKLFEINAEYLRSSPTKQAELLKKNIVLIKQSNGQDLSVNEVFRNFGLTTRKS